MRAPKIYVVSVLIIIWTPLAAGYAQTSNARPVPEVVNGQDSSSKPSNPGADTATGSTPDAANNPRPGLQRKPLRPGQRVDSASSVSANQSSLSALTSQVAVPQSVLFEMFFNNLEVLNQVADADEKAGKHNSASEWRRLYQKGAGLNDAEGDILRETVLDCLQSLKVQDAKFRVAAEKFRAQLTPGAPEQIPPDLAQLFDDRKKIIADHIEALKTALGEASFAKLDSFVHSSFHVEMIAPKSATPSGATVELNKKESK
jgi:hypothetical protein